MLLTDLLFFSFLSFFLLRCACLKRWLIWGEHGRISLGQSNSGYCGLVDYSLSMWLWESQILCLWSSFLFMCLGRQRIDDDLCAWVPAAQLGNLEGGLSSPSCGLAESWLLWAFGVWTRWEIPFSLLFLQISPFFSFEEMHVSHCVTLLKSPE